MEKRRDDDRLVVKALKMTVGVLVAILISLVGWFGVESKGDIKDVKKQVDINCNRLTAVEKDIAYIKESAKEQKELMQQADKILRRVERKLDEKGSK